MKKSKGRIVFEVINVIVLSLLSFACLFPLLNFQAVQQLQLEKFLFFLLNLICMRMIM